MKDNLSYGEAVVTETADNIIIELFFARDEKAITEFERVYRKMCMTIARSITGNESDAEECVNDAALRLWNSIPPERPDSLKAYAGRIVRNLSLNRVEHENAAKRCAILVELDECIADDTPDIDADALSEVLDTFLETLKPLDAKLFVRRYWYSEPVGQLAKRFGFSENKVTKRLARTRVRLAKYLSERGAAL